MKYLIGMLLSTILLFSCGSNEADQDKDLNVAASASNSGDSLQPTSTTTGTAGVEVAGLTKASTGVVSMPQLNTGGAVAGKVALNPEHGQPGHRCELAVGAPLNSNAAQPAAMQPTATITPMSVNGTAPVKAVNVPTKSSSSAALNPAHGAPGHRCEISVGAPLNSAPAAGAKPVNSPASNIISSSPTIAPTVQAPANAVSSTGAKLNPAHGQPGHDCKVAVGQPLN